MTLPSPIVVAAVHSAAAAAGINPVLIYSPTRGRKPVSDARAAAIRLAFSVGATRAEIARTLGRDWTSVNQALGGRAP
jgi:DNA-binding transcriptional regulator YdaS (Cro superfamily)